MLVKLKRFSRRTAGSNENIPTTKAISKGAEHGPPYEWQVRVVHADRIAEAAGELLMVSLTSPPPPTSNGLSHGDLAGGRITPNQIHPSINIEFIF